MLAAYSVVIASGAPLPMAWLAAAVAPTVGESAANERFPCEGCPCGCGTAEHCWAKCCCHTLPQRLAWARREGVRPPEKVLDQASASGYDVTDWRPDAIYQFRLPKAVTTTDKDLDKLPPCCRARAAKARLVSSPEKAPAQTPTEAPAKPGISLMQSLACQGLAEAWLSLGEAPQMSAIELVVKEALATPCDFSAPLWCHIDEAPTPPPPEMPACVVS